MAVADIAHTGSRSGRIQSVCQGICPCIQFIIIQRLINMDTPDKDSRMIILGHDHGLNIHHHNTFKLIPSNGPPTWDL